MCLYLQAIEDKMAQQNEKYHPEPYWSEVAKKIKARKGTNVLAGDDEPFYRYKRARFLNMLRTLDFKGKKVLELGCGPGGNLLEVYKGMPSRLVGADISADMVEIAGNNTPEAVEIVKINGLELPFADAEFDLVFSVTVLQHNTDAAMMRQILSEMCRVSASEVVLFERIEHSLKGDDLCMGRPVDYYAEICGSQGFELVETSFINIRSSYLVCGAIRKGLNPSSRKEGDPLTPFSFALQNGTLHITKLLDKAFPSRTDLGKLVFRRKQG
jgi:SAM-dependent methyltransferase